MSRMNAFVEQCMPTEPPVYRVTDIDFEQWAHEGVKGLVLDIEGTMGETGQQELVAEHVGKIIEAREVGIEYVAIATNKMVTTRRDRRLLRAWGDQLDADLILTPLSPDQAKPSPIMNYKFMEHFSLSGAEVGVVGDKATADIRAGYFAGVEHRAWTRPFGGNQHIGDRIVRAPFESILRLQAHLQLTPEITHAIPEIQDEGTDFADVLSFVAEEISPGQADGKDRIVGFGVEDIQLSEETLASIKRPAFRVALENLKNFADYYGEAPAEHLKAFLYEHGRTTADLLTYSRVAIAGGLLAVRMSNLEPATKQKLSAALITLGAITDLLDGPSARAHKHGATVEGGKNDQNIDKVLTAATDVLVLLPRGLISEMDLMLSNGRDILMTALRNPFARRGIDTKSIWSGKGALDAKVMAQIMGAAVGKRYPGLNRVLQRTATGAKVGSAVHAPFVWVERHERKQHDANNLAKLAVLAEKAA